MEINAAGVPADVASSLGLLVPTEVRQALPGAAVVSGEEVRSMLGFEAQRQALGCEGDSGCLAEIAGALGVDEVLTGRVGKLGRTFVLELRRIDIKKAKVVASVTSTVTGAEDELVGAMRALVARVYGLASRESAPAAAVSPPVEPTRTGSRGTLALGLGLAGLVAGGAGIGWSLSTNAAYVAQQDGVTQPTVTRTTAERAQVIYPVSIGLAVAGAVTTIVGAVMRSSSAPATEGR
jgi:hypothetical protein